MKKQNLISRFIIVSALSVFLVACNSDKNKNADTNSQQSVSTQESTNDNNKNSHDNDNNHNHNHDHDHDHDARENATLADWNGSWDNVHTHFLSDEAKGALEEAAKEEGETPDEFKTELDEKRHADFASFKVEDDKITFYSEVGCTGNELYSGNYMLNDVKEVKHGSSTLHWYEFKDDNKDSAFPILLMMDLHGEDVVPHFHLRYGNNLDELLDESSNWYPTFVNSQTPADMIIEMLHHH